MSSSLAEQLALLKTPESSLFKHTKKKPSVLFDPSKAASHDNQFIYDLALSGFVELKSINPKFTEFEDTLYDQSSVSFERAVHNKEENAIIDKRIKKFLHLLSPYFMLKASLKVLEWLIRRYHINLYNVDDLVMLALPYHETNTFVRVIQVLNLSEENGRWHWLKPIQKPCVPLSKHALLNHCASSPSFLKLLCDTTIDATNAHGPDGAHVLTTLLAFYCTTVIGALEQSGTKVTELQITHLLEALIRGYASRSVDFVAASYMITAQLVTKASLSTGVLERLVWRVVKKLRHPDVLPDSTLLLIVVYQNQHSLTSMPVKAVLQLGNIPNFPEIIGEIAKSHRVTPLLVPIIKQALSIIQSHDESSTCMKTLVEQLLAEVKLDTEDADAVVRAVIDKYQSPDEEMSDNVIDKDGIIKWYASLLQSLERAHPSVFDAAVCRTLKGEGISQGRAEDLKSMLGFELPLDLLDKLRHPKAEIRAKAARTLSTKCSSFTEKDLQALQGSLENFLLDDDPIVVISALSFPPAVLQDVLGNENLRQALIALLKRSVIAADLKQWSSVVKLAVQILCALKIENGPQEIETLLALLPLFSQDKVVKRVFSSKFKNQNRLLRQIWKTVQETTQDKIISSERVLPALVQCLLNESNLVDPSDVLEVAERIKGQTSDDAHWYVDRFYTALLLAASVPKGADPSLGLKLLEENDNLLGSKKLFSLGKGVELNTTLLAAGLNVCRKRALPIQCSFQLLSAVISRIKTECRVLRPWFNLQNDSDQTKLQIEVYRKILAGCVHSNKRISSAYVGQLQLFFKQHCPTAQDRLAFLFSVSTFHEVSMKPEYRELALRSLRLSRTFLSGSEEWSLQTDGDSNAVPALLLALQCPSQAVRHVACDVTRFLVQSTEKPFHLKVMLQKILAMKDELKLDEKQLQVILQNILSPMSEFKSAKFQTHVLNSLLSCILSETTPSYVSAGLLKALTAVNSEEILESLLPLIRRSLEIGNKSDEPNRFCSEIVRNVLGRLDASTCGCLCKSDPWEAIVAAFKDQKTPILGPSGKVTRPAVVICEQIDGSLWEALSILQGSLQERLLTLLLASRSVAEYPEVISALSSAFRRITLDSATAVPALLRMKDVQVQEPLATRKTSLVRRSIPKAPSTQILQTDEWRQGMALLELLQIKKKLNNVHLLIPILFDLLKRCLDFEEQAPVEYTKQVLLSCILLCCSKMHAEESQQAKSSTKESVINVELVVQCIRASQNPQTHHHALLVLTHLGDLVPEQVLHNIMAIFTFMGSLVLRQDDAYSFQVTSKILETIIPVLVKSSDSDIQGKLEETVASVMRVFVDALLDVPEHRRLGLYRKLLSTLDASRFLWVFLCLVFESHVVQPRTETSETKRRGASSLQTEVPKRLEVALQLVHEFPLETIFVNCVALLQYVRMLPVELDEKTGKRPPVSGELAKYNITTLFNAEQNSPKILRHYKYTIVTFLSALLSSKPLVEKMASVEEISLQSIEPVYHSFLASLLSYIQNLNQQVNSSKSPQSTKYWSVMLGQTCEILDKVNALLPSSMFITVISGLLVHNIQLLRRKALELLNARLSTAHSKQFMLTCDSESLLKLLKPLMDIVSTIEDTQIESMDEEMEDNEKSVLNKNVQDLILTQQTAVYSLKVLTRLLAYDHRDTFTPILEKVTNLLKMRTSLDSKILATLILCCAELCSALKAHAIVALPSLVPRMIELLSKHSSNLSDGPHLVLLTVASAVLRIVDTLPNFLSPYLEALLGKVCTLLAQCSKRVSEEGEGCKWVPVVNKLNLAGQKMSTSIAPRVLFPAVSQCYQVLKSEVQLGVGPLMTILSDSFAGLNPADLRNLLSDLTDFFLNALNYRDECVSQSADKDVMAQVECVEGHVIKAWVSLVLKLSETSFKPLFYKLYDWATRLDSHKDRVITFYRLSYRVSDCLKGLFPSYSGYFLKNAAMLLDHCNITKVGEPDETEFNDQENDRPAELYFGMGKIAEKKCASLIEHILNTLKNVFLYDSQDFVNRETFEGLVRPIIDQLENTVDGMDSLKSRAEKILIPCIAQFAVALDDDIVWKHINYQILLKTKHKNPQIRLISLEAVCKVVHKLGDSFLPLIPETMPFLAELLEDEDENVEKACRHAVQDLEQVLGEPLQKYF